MHLRPLRSALLLALPVFALACGRKTTTDGAGGGGTPVASSAKGGGPSAEPAALLPGATCTFPERVNVDTTIKAGCVTDVLRNVLVESGSTLTIEPGATLRFKEATYLEVGHKGSRLMAKGTIDKPVVFTSGSAKKHPGDWVGVVFDDATGDSLIEHAVIEYAGRESHGGQGALTVFSAFPAGKVSVRDTAFKHNNLTAIANKHAKATFGAFERNTFEDNARDMRVSASVLSAVGEANTFSNVIEVTGGTVTTSGAWPKTKSPFLISDPINVNGEKDAAVLTIADGSVLKFAPKTWLEVGTGGPGGLQAANVTFTSAAEKPEAGDWVGLLFGDRTMKSRVVTCIIEYAGAEEHGGDAAVTVVGTRSLQGLDLNISTITFRHLKQGHFSSNGDGCDKVLDPKNGNSWAGGGIEPCK